MWFEERGVETKTEVCTAGHILCFYVPTRRRRDGVCLVCGSPTLADCPACGSPIGRRVDGGFMPVIRKSSGTLARRGLYGAVPPIARANARFGQKGGSRTQKPGSPPEPH